MPWFIFCLITLLLYLEYNTWASVYFLCWNNRRGYRNTVYYRRNGNYTFFLIYFGFSLSPKNTKAGLVKGRGTQYTRLGESLTIPSLPTPKSETARKYIATAMLTA